MKQFFNLTRFKSDFVNIDIVKFRFDENLKNEEKEGNVSQYYICGPGRFTKAIQERLE